MIIVREFSEVARQSGFTEYDHLIQALPPNGADHPLHIGSLPGRPERPEYRLVSVARTLSLKEINNLGSISWGR